MFQSTHPQGVRHVVRYGIMASEHVSIHAPTRSAPTAAFLDYREQVSIHAPTRSATAFAKLLKYKSIELSFCEITKNIRFYKNLPIQKITTNSLSTSAKSLQFMQHFKSASNNQFLINIHHHLFSYRFYSFFPILS